MALFVLYGDGEGVKKGRTKKERTEKRNRDEVHKISLPLPNFLLCFSFGLLIFLQIGLLIFLQKFCSNFFPYYIVFSLYNLLPLKCVMLETTSQHIWYQSLVQRRV
jgi:hypothetical protein